MAYNGPDKGNSGSPLLKLILAALLLVLAVQLYRITQPEPPAPPASHGLETKVAPELPATPPAGQTNPPPAAETEETPASFGVSGRVTQLFFKERAWVKQGDILATIDKEPYEKALIGAKARLQIAQEQSSTLLSYAPNPNFAAIEVARAHVEAAQHTYDFAREELEKRRRMQVPGELDHVYNDDVQNEHDAELGLQRAQRKLVHEEQIGREALEENAYTAAIHIARNHVADAESELADTQLVATTDGIIVSRNVEVGDNVAPGATVYTIAAPVKVSH